MGALRLEYLDPRVKLLLMIVYSTAALAVQSPVALLTLLSLSLITILAGRVSLKDVWMKLRALFGLIATLFLLQCLFDRGGEPLLVISELKVVTVSGFQTAVLVNLRLLIIILSALIVATGETRDYLLAMNQLKVPYEIAFMVLAALRFLPMLREEARDILSAAQMRGLRIKKAGLKAQTGAYISLVIPVVAGAIRRAEQLSIAMEARSFRALPKRTSMRRLRMRPHDWAYLAVFCLIVSVLLIIVFAGWWPL